MGTIIPANPYDVAELERLRQLENKLREWIDTNHVYCEESIYQSDRVQEALYELGAIVCDELGYYEDDFVEDDDDE